MTSYSNRCAALAAAEGCSLINVAFIRSNRICRSSKAPESNVRFGAGDHFSDDRFSRIFVRGTKYRRIVAIAYVHITRSVDQAVILRAKLSRKRWISLSVPSFALEEIEDRRTYEYCKETSYVTINDLCNSRFQVFLRVRTSTTLSLTASIGVTDRCFNS